MSEVLVEDYVRRLQQRGLTDSYHLLTDREKEVLQLLAEGRSNKEVAQLLDLGLSTVETHRAQPDAEAEPSQHSRDRPLCRPEGTDRLSLPCGQDGLAFARRVYWGMAQVQPVTTRNAPANPPRAGETGRSRHSSALVVVQHDWKGWRKAMTPVHALEDVHWHQPPGAPRRIIHAYVSCADLTSGDVPHECGEAGGPHRLLVCVLKCHTAPSVFEELARRADHGAGH